MSSITLAPLPLLVVTVCAITPPGSLFSLICGRILTGFLRMALMPTTSLEDYISIFNGVDPLSHIRITSELGSGSTGKKIMARIGTMMVPLESSPF